MILGLDAALRISGWAVFSDDGEYVSSGTWTTNSKDSLSDRLDYILRQIESLTKEYDIDKIIYEDVQEQHNNVMTYRRLVSVSTIIEYWCEFAQIKWVRVSPSHWRKVITQKTGQKFGRKRAEQKITSKAIVSSALGRALSDDETDAVLIAQSAIWNKEFEDKYRESAF